MPNEFINIQLYTKSCPLSTECLVTFQCLHLPPCSLILDASLIVTLADSRHNLVQPFIFKILTQVQSKNINIRKITEALFIQKYKPALHTQGASVDK